MTLERTLRGAGGAFVLLSLLLAHFHSPWWLLFTAFMGLKLLQPCFTNWWPTEFMPRRFGMRICKDEILALKTGGV